MEAIAIFVRVSASVLAIWLGLLLVGWHMVYLIDRLHDRQG
jgi:hypothetical protein